MSLKLLIYFSPVFTFGHLSGEISSSDYSTVVIVPDIHGDSESFLRSIWLAYNDESPSPATFEDFANYFPDAPQQPPLPFTNNSEIVLVQLGDIFDRGPNGLRCLRILDLIPSVLGWKVVRIYGNHEIMNRIGSAQRYIHPLEPAQFIAAFPTSRDARVAEFQPGGSVWESILNSTVLVARFGSPTDTAIPPVSSSSALFVHAGVEPMWVDRLVHRHNKSADPVSIVDSINEIAHQLLSNPIITNQHDVFNSLDALTMRQSPLWIRDMARIGDEYVCEVLLPPILAKFQTARIIVGHTADVEDLKVRSLCDSRFILADAAMSRWMLQVQWSSSDLDPLVPPTSDPFGRPAVGNPTALIMRQERGTLNQFKALYYNSTSAITSQQSIYPELSASLFMPKPNPTAYHVLPRDPLPIGPRNIFAPSTIPGSNALFFAEIRVENICQKIAGIWRYRFMDELRRMQTRGLFNSFGIPFIPFVSKPDPTDTTFHVVYQTSGVPLRQVIGSEMTLSLTWVRQIFRVIRDLRNAGVCINFHGIPTDAATVLDMFIIEHETELVKLIDFSNVFSIPSEVCEKDWAQYLATWCAQFVLAANSYPVNDHVPFAKLVSEIFGQDVLGTTEDGFQELIRDILELLAPQPSSGRSSSSDFFPIRIEEFTAGEAWTFGDPPIADVLKLRQTMALVDTFTGSMEIIVTDAYPHGATLVHIAETIGDSSWKAFRHLLSSWRLEEFRIPPVLDTLHRLDDSVYLVLNATGDSLSTVYFAEMQSIAPEVIDQVFESLRRVIEMGVIFDLADLPLQAAAFKVLELFIIDEARENVHLVLLPAMHLAKGHSEPAIEAVKEQEMAKLHAVIDCAFVSKTLLSLTRGIPTVSGENLDERLVTRTTRLPQATTYDFDELLDSIIPRSLLGSETAEMVIQPTTVKPSGSFHVSLRTGIYFNISDTMDQPDSSTGYPR